MDDQLPSTSRKRKAPSEFDQEDPEKKPIDPILGHTYDTDDDSDEDMAPNAKMLALDDEEVFHENDDEIASLELEKIQLRDEFEEKMQEIENRLTEEFEEKMKEIDEKIALKWKEKKGNERPNLNDKVSGGDISPMVDTDDNMDGVPDDDGKNTPPK